MKFFLRTSPKRREAHGCGWKGLLRGIVFLWLVLAASSGKAEVFLEFAEDFATVQPGGSFTFGISLRIDGLEQVTGFDYLLQGSGASYDANFTIVSRQSNITNFPDLNSPDSAIAGLVLDPWEDLSLGASVTDPFSPVSGAGSYHLADFVFSVNPSTPAGVYVVSPVFANWFNQDFETQSFTSVESFVVTVVPEPRTLFLALLPFAGLAWRGLRRAGL